MYFRSWSLNIATNGFGLGEGGLCGNKSLPAFAKPVLYEVPTYLAGCSIETLNRKTKRKKAMETKDLSKWEFEKELKTMAVSCIGVKEDTAKKKASNIFKKYDEILAYSKSDKEYYEKEYRKTKNMFDTLKSGVINYTRGKVVGRLLLKDIEQVEIREKDVLLITKTGREITMGNDFNYLKELF